MIVYGALRTRHQRGAVAMLTLAFLLAQKYANFRLISPPRCRWDSQQEEHQDDTAGADKKFLEQRHDLSYSTDSIWKSVPDSHQRRICLC